VFDNRLGAPKDCSSGLLYRFQVPDTMRNYALALLFEAFFEPSVRGELRADKELGYAVLSFMRREWNAVYWNILIQTDRRMSLAETFVANFMASTIPRELELLKDENVFAQLCNGCISNLRQPYQSLQEQCEAQFKEIESLKPDFDFRRRVADLIESKALSSADLIEFARSYILPMASKRRLLLVRTHAQPDSKPQSALAIRELSEPELVPTVQDVHETVIESLGAWKRSRPLNGSNSKL
jgi:secreted Zn-dependent insulinase-like peptidase